MFRQYLLLIRLPNTFTAPSNILTGYFAITSPAYAHSQQLFILILSSVLIYIAGTVFNDYFDIEIDLKERPYRPLPAGTITKQKAFVIAIVSLVSANILAFAVSWSSFVISTILSATVISYDFRLKNTVIGPITMGVKISERDFRSESCAFCIAGKQQFLCKNDICQLINIFICVGNKPA